MNMNAIKSLAAGCIAVACLSAGAAERLPIDARMIGEGERSLRGWTFNEVEGFKPYGEVRPVMLNGHAGVRLISTGRQTQLYHATSLPVKAGDSLLFTAKVRGKGRASIGFFMYGKNWAWKGSSGAPVAVDAGDADEPVEIRERLCVPEDVTGVRPTLCVNNGDSVEFYDLRLERETK